MHEKLVSGVVAHSTQTKGHQELTDLPPHARRRTDVCVGPHTPLPFLFVSLFLSLLEHHETLRSSSSSGTKNPRLRSSDAGRVQACAEGNGGERAGQRHHTGPSPALTSEAGQKQKKGVRRTRETHPTRARSFYSQHTPGYMPPNDRAGARLHGPLLPLLVLRSLLRSPLNSSDRTGRRKERGRGGVPPVRTAAAITSVLFFFESITLLRRQKPSSAALVCVLVCLCVLFSPRIHTHTHAFFLQLH